MWLGWSDSAKDVNWDEIHPSLLVEPCTPEGPVCQGEGAHLLGHSTTLPMETPPQCPLSISDSGPLASVKLSYPRNFPEALPLAQVCSPWQFLSLMRSL